MIKINKYSILSVLLLFLVSCDSFLDELPDNRTTIDSADKIRKLLTSAYPNDGFAVVTELSTDNIVDEGDNNPNTTPIFEEMAYWKDVNYTDNDDTKSLWESSYLAIAHANEALNAISELGESTLKAEKAEALMARAYSHFILVNVFAKHYNANSSASDLGVPYAIKAEKVLNPKYERESVQAVYEKINADIEEALPYIDDNIYEQAKYHFNKKAAYAFAARFNLYYEKWDKAKEYANKVLESGELVNWGNLNTLTTNMGIRANALMNDNGVLLLQTDTSNAGLLFGAYYFGARINHTRFIANRETVYVPAPWGNVGTSTYQSRPFSYSANNYQKVNFPKNPYAFQTTDVVAQIGYRKAVFNLFTTDEALLIKAEANIMLNNTTEALADLNRWSKNFYRGNAETTLSQINTFYDAIPYSTGTATGLTQKKKLSPSFTISAGDQENMLHYLLQCRRILTLHEGLRWFDIKRYGIEVHRLKKNVAEQFVLVETLTANDNRKAIQIPNDVVTSGIAPNPR